MNETLLLVAQARRLSKTMYEYLLTDGLLDLVPGIEAILGELDAVPRRMGPAEALINAESIYKSIAGGPGSLSDVVLWRENDVLETARVNEEFHHLRGRLWKVLVDRQPDEHTALAELSD